MGNPLMAGHTIDVYKQAVGRRVLIDARERSAIEGDSWRKVWYGCRDCDTHGYVYAVPPDLADRMVADIMAVHWGATGGDS